MTAARLTTDDIARARAVDIDGIVRARDLRLSGRKSLQGPCPHCGGTDRFWINLRRQQFGCRGCGVGGGGAISFVQFLDRLDFVAAVETLIGVRHDLTNSRNLRNTAARKPSADDETERKQHAARLWHHRQPIIGGIAETYVREGRGYRGPLPATLGFLPAWRDVPPAMIAACGIASEAEPGILVPPREVVAVHLTYLKPDGSGKADIEKPKQFRGTVLGRPIVLAPSNDLLGLAICEGIEDALSVHAVTGLGAWAAGSAGMLPALAKAVPSFVNAITIYAHADRAGQDGAHALAKAIGYTVKDVRIEGL